MSYTPHTADEVELMLERIGVADVHELFDRISALSGLATRGPEVVIRPS